MTLANLLLALLLTANPAVAQGEQMVNQLRYTEALELLLPALAQTSASQQPGEFAQLAILAARAHHGLGEFESAFTLRSQAYDAARLSRSGPLLAVAALDYGQALAWRSRLRPARQHYLEAEKLFAAANNKTGLALVAVAQANLELDLGRLDLAREYLEKARQLAPPSPASQAAEARLAVAGGDPQSATRILSQLKEPIARANLGAALVEAGQYSQALPVLTEVVEKAPTSTAGLVARLSLSRLYLALGDFERSLSELREALLSSEAMPASWEGWLRLNQALGHAALGENDIARELLGRPAPPLLKARYQLELAALSPDPAPLLAGGRKALVAYPDPVLSLWYDLAEAQAAQDATALAAVASAAIRADQPEVVWRAEFSAGQLARAKDQPAMPHYQKALQVMDELSGRLSDHDLRTSFSQEKHRVYFEAIDLLLSQSRVEQAYELSERGRGRLLAELWRRERMLLPASEAPPIPAGTVLLSYQVGRDHSYLFIRTGSTLRAVRLEPGSAELLGAIGDGSALGHLRPATRVAGSDHQTFPDQLAANLYRQLIEPAAPELAAARRLVILPDGPLYYLPFGLLRGSNGFLIEQLPLSQSVSAEALQAPSRHPSQALAAYAAPTWSSTAAPATLRFSRDSLAPLPGAKQEAENIGALYPDSALRVGSQCLESRFKAEAAAFRVLHFATHGFADEASPLRSGLLMATEPGQDGVLEAREVAGMRLNAELAVLSACDTGLGRVSGGEGMVGLTYSFQAAGVANVIASLWPVPDAETRQLMTDFHAALRQGANPAVALRQAQLAQLAKGTSPYSWGAFELVGALER
ncbi:MAG: CHAT domain-containing protein [Vulcanimicrobiota bacterium]